MTAPARTVRLATRGSALALAQTAIAAKLLQRAARVRTEIVVVHSRGDREATTPAAQLEGTGWFTAELEAALLDGRADAAVHSAKDLPTQLGAGPQATIAIVERGDPRDALVTRDGRGLDELHAGCTVGTSSLRREGFLRALRPDLRSVPIRGNVDTRLRKLDEGQVDALLVAAAGLDRLGLGDRASVRLPAETFVPAPAQGAIAVETARAEAAALTRRVDDHDHHTCVLAERTVLEALGGGCRLPLGVWARYEGDDVVVVAALATEHGLRRVEAGGEAVDWRETALLVAEGLRA